MENERQTKAELLKETKGPEDLVDLLSRREEAFKGISENLVDIIRLSDDFGVIRFASESHYAVLGYKPEEIIGRHVLEFVHPDDVELVLNEMRAAYLGKSSSKAIYRHRHAEGGYRWLEAYGKVLLDRQGNITGAIFGSRDITQRKEAEEEIKRHENQLEELINIRTFKLHQLNSMLAEEIEARKRSEEAKRASEERFRLIIDNISSGILFTDFQGRIIMANPLARELLGLGKNAAGKSLTAFFPLADELLSQDHLGMRSTLEIYATNGGRRYLGFTNVAITQADGGLITIFNDITKEHEAEMENKQLSQFQKSIINNSNIWLTVLDENDRFIIWNRAAEKISGYTKGEVPTFAQALKLALLQADALITPEIAETAAAIYRAGGHLEDYESVMRCKDGSLKTIVWNADNIVDDDGKTRFTMSIGWDITERKLMEETLKKKEELFRLMIENSSDVIAILNPDGGFRYLSPSFEKNLGYERSLFMSQEAFAWVHPDDIDKVKQSFLQSILNPGTPIMVNYRMRHRDGSWRYLETIAFNLLDYPEIQGIMSNSRDITDRKNAEEEMKKREEKLRLMVENLTDVITILNAEGKIIYESPSIERIIGERPEEIVNRNAFDYIHPDDLLEVLNIFTRGTKNPGQMASVIYRVRNRKTGEWRYIESIGINLLDNPAIQGVVITSRDITDQKKLEEEKEKMQAQILQGHKMEALGTLAGGIAHDFNNILAAIIGFTELALKEYTLDQVHDHLDEVLKAGFRAKALVKQILTFSRQGIKEKEPININQITREVLNLLRPTLPKNILLRQNLEAESALAMGDATQIHQVLMNLCSNALHAMRDQGGILEVSLKELDSTYEKDHYYENLLPGAYLRITVRDTGQGISREILARIFDPYFTTRRTGEGTGLGLAVVQGIVKRHNGIIKVESEVGQGSAFHVFLPRLHYQRELDCEPPKTINYNTGEENILFVDDDLSLVLLWRNILARFGYRVTGQASSLQALELFKKMPHKFDLVITDQIMPDMTGIEMAQAMMEIRPDMRIILCTGFSEGIDEVATKKLGIKAFVLKPLAMDAMLQVIREVLPA